ncbi:MAG: long-chain fatty acid--CoA ligase [Spirochaetales bacterium]|nr:long-chain fatty acid--CoA ligase [Spirochaetales bacterium]
MKSSNDTLPQRLKLICTKYADLAIFLIKDQNQDFQPIKFKDFWESLKIYSAGLNAIGIKRGDQVGLISENRKEWIMTDFGLSGLGAIDVPRGCDSTSDEIRYILAHADCKVTFTENCAQAEKILSQIKDIGLLKKIVLYDTKGIEKLKIPEGIEILSFDDVVKLGQEAYKNDPDFYEREVEKGSCEETATIIYTSGTTGNPKGVMLTHKAFLFQVDRIKPHLDLCPGEIMLSVLPIWHSFERACMYISVFLGLATAFSKPIGPVMMPDMAKVKPQWLTSVPRIWESVHAAVLRNINSGSAGKKTLFYFFLTIGEIHTYLYDMFTGLLPQFSKRNRFIDIAVSIIPLLVLTPFKKLGQVLVFSKLKAKLGGRFKAGISGGGALPSHIDKFFRTVGITVLEGYGLTETAPILAVRKDSRPIPNTVGPLLEDIEYRVISKDGAIMPIGFKGELHVKSQQVMQGYYKEPEKTAEILKNGWLNTGDIAVFTHTGEFKILGRSKDTIVLRGGENVEPVPIEDKLNQSDYISQIMVVGQDQKFLGALIVPNLEELEKLAIEKQISFLEKEELVNNPFIHELMQEEIQSLVDAKTGFKAFERIFRFIILPKEFEIGVEMTQSLKIRRNVVEKMYKNEIKELFK